MHKQRDVCYFYFLFGYRLKKSIACLFQEGLHKAKIIIFHCEATKVSELIKRGTFSIKLTVTTLVKSRMKMKRHE